MANRGEGLGYKWILEHKSYPHEDWCLIWPFARHHNGRGLGGHNGKSYRAHRMMCQIAHGEPPTPGHHAAHSCGSGHLGCVNPRHLSWKTASENLLDCAAHGTHPKSRFGAKGRFNAAQIAEIRELLETNTHRAIAELFGVNETTIGNIATGRFYSKPMKINFWTPQEDDKIRECVALGMSFPQMAKEFPNRAPNAIVGRTYRLGLSSGRKPTRTDYSTVSFRQGEGR